MAMICLWTSHTWAENDPSQKRITVFDPNDDVPTYRTTYNIDNNMTPHVRYQYTYDNKKRMKSVTVYRWNQARQNWTPRYISKYHYHNGEINVETHELDQEGYKIDKSKNELSFIPR